MAVRIDAIGQTHKVLHLSALKENAGVLFFHAGSSSFRAEFCKDGHSRRMLARFSLEWVWALEYGTRFVLVLCKKVTFKEWPVPRDPTGTIASEKQNNSSTENRNFTDNEHSFRVRKTHTYKCFKAARRQGNKNCIQIFECHSVTSASLTNRLCQQTQNIRTDKCQQLFGIETDTGLLVTWSL